MNKLLVLLLVFTVSAMTTVRTDANFIQTLLAGIATIDTNEISTPTAIGSFHCTVAWQQCSEKIQS